MKFHPIADIFPLMEGAEFSSLVESIKTNGQREPIVTHDGKILDGRNRWRACKEAKVDPKTKEYHGKDPLAYVIDLNLKRRHLDESQRAMVGARIATLKNGSRPSQNCEAPKATRAKAATSLNVGTRSIDSARVVLDHGVPELVAAVDHGKMPVSQAAKATKLPVEAQRKIAASVEAGVKPTEAARGIRREDLAKKTAELPKGKHRVIYTDPPWQYNDTRSGVEGMEGSAAEGQYPTMSVQQLSDLAVQDLAAADSVLFCWATFPLLPDALEVIRAWGFKYKTAFVWAKVRPNFGHYHNANAELLLVCTRGSATPDADKRESQVQTIERTGKHSSKPEDFRAMIDRLYTTGKRIELFRRGAAPDGWEVWGNEAEKNE